METNYTTQQKMTLYVAMITSFLTTFTGSALNLSIPAMGADLHVSAGLIGWLITGYTLAVAALSVPFGRIADLTNRRKILIAGIFLFGICSLICGFVTQIWVLILLRIVQGLGGAMIFATNTALLIGAFPDSQRGKVLGYSISCTYIGLSAGPVLGGIFNHYFGWQSIFLLTFAVSAAVFFIAAKRMPDPGQQVESHEFDGWGSGLCALMIVASLYGLSLMCQSNLSYVLIGFGALFFAAFVRHEMKTASPVIDVTLFMKNKGYAFSNLAALLNYGATFAISYLLSIYLQVVVGYGSQKAGLVLIIQPVIQAALSPRMGRLSDTVSPFKLSSFGMALCAVSLFIFSRMQETTALWVIILGLVIAGVGFAFFSSPNTNAVMACVEKEDYGVASSLLATMRTIGHSASMAVLTVIISVYMQDVELSNASPTALVQTMHTSFLVFMAICLAGIFVSLKRK